ncbi:Zinc finger protein CONSTANS-LIKE 4 [Nymphaea thermarum]|nr:Zinc finger protein CONSTANS-LIKE 4 [Nymphaea thermarum]
MTWPNGSTQNCESNLFERCHEPVDDVIVPLDVPLSPCSCINAWSSHGWGWGTSDAAGSPRRTMALSPYSSSPRRTKARQLIVPDMQSHLPELVQAPPPATNAFWAAAAATPLPEGPGQKDALIPPSALLTFSGHEETDDARAMNVRRSGQEGLAELQRSSVFQRSLSSQSLEQLSVPLLRHKSAPFQPFLRSPSENSAFNSELSGIQSDTPSMRRVFSAGDLRVSRSLLFSVLERGSLMMYSGHESGSSLGLENFVNGAQKVARYNAEEKKERIQRYRSKRNQRNFNKKITYACRKTLADSRPRVRGRFARNEEQGENSTQMQWNQIEDDDDDENWIHLFDGNYTQVP